MPFESKSQMRKFFAMEKRHELPKGKAEEWAHKTKDLKSLPEHVKKSELYEVGVKIALDEVGLMKQAVIFPSGDDVHLSPLDPLGWLAIGAPAAGAGLLASKLLPSRLKALALLPAAAAGVGGGLVANAGLKHMMQSLHDKQQRARAVADLSGAGLGAGIGALASPEHRGRGALMGAGIGAAVPETAFQVVNRLR